MSAEIVHLMDISEDGVVHSIITLCCHRVCLDSDIKLATRSRENCTCPAVVAVEQENTN